MGKYRYCDECGALWIEPPKGDGFCPNDQTTCDPENVEKIRKKVYTDYIELIEGA